ncbi:hypothetical protein R3P38DRAFT_598503 [Favolaschia claudopus]|uniref:Uncharacterized protein n=1 Tax=Favolaschia claudopus TaxID=2862362 RepID=A0AAV9Z831_9AGAR
MPRRTRRTIILFAQPRHSPATNLWVEERSCKTMQAGRDTTQKTSTVVRGIYLPGRYRPPAYPDGTIQGRELCACLSSNLHVLRNVCKPPRTPKHPIPPRDDAIDAPEYTYHSPYHCRRTPSPNTGILRPKHRSCKTSRAGWDTTRKLVPVAWGLSSRSRRPAYRDEAIQARGCRACLSSNPHVLRKPSGTPHTPSRSDDAVDAPEYPTSPTAPPSPNSNLRVLHLDHALKGRGQAETPRE